MRPAETRAGPRLTAVAVALVAAAVSMGAAAFTGGESSPRGEDVTSVVERPDRFIGERTTVTGRVGDIMSATSFTVIDDAATLLVLNVSTIPAIDDNHDGVVRNEEVLVTGVVRRFAMEEIEQLVGDLLDERYESFVGKPVLVADSVSPRRATETRIR